MLAAFDALIPNPIRRKPTMSLTVFHVLGFVLCVLAIAAIGLWSGRV
jgi:hypothetical protein